MVAVLEIKKVLLTGLELHMSRPYGDQKKYSYDLGERVFL